MIVKPSISYASVNITDESVVWSAADALKQAANLKLTGGLVGDGIFAEKKCMLLDVSGFPQQHACIKRRHLEGTQWDVDNVTR